MAGASSLRDLMQGQRLVVAPGAYDALTAQMVELAGFSAVYMTGAGACIAKGFPDYGLLTLTEMVENAATISRAIRIPLISDADTGYGNELNVARTVQEFEARGVQAIHIEDQVFPKRCGHLEGKEVIPAEAFASKIRAAVAARRTSGFVIIARTDARAATSFEDAIRRANLSIQSGADMAFVEAPQSRDEIAAVPRLVNGPCVLNVVAGGKTPMLSQQEAEDLGYRLAIYPGATLLPALAAMQEALAAMKDPVAPPAAGPPPGAIFGQLGAGVWDEIRSTAWTEDK